MSERELESAFARLLEEPPPRRINLSDPVKATIERKRALEIAAHIGVCAAFAALCGLMVSSVAEAAASHLGGTWLVMIPLVCICALIWAALIEALTLCFIRE